MKPELREFLEAKYNLDSRSLNRHVLRNLKTAIENRKQINWLDLGTGTGAMVHRLIENKLPNSADITAIDTDQSLLDAAGKKLGDFLRRNAFRTEVADGQICGYRRDQELRIRFECASILDWVPQHRSPHFDLITAHAVMDLLPLQPALDKLAKLVKPEGLFYATLNYDGDTSLHPLYPEQSIEQRILQNYDRSMEHRRVDRQATGGARSGRRLVSLLANSTLDVHCYGSSDWNITPVNRKYRGGDRYCLQALLEMMRDQALQTAEFDPGELDSWFAHRNEETDSARLGMIVHQLDVLAVNSATPSRDAD